MSNTTPQCSADRSDFRRSAVHAALIADPSRPDTEIAAELKCNSNFVWRARRTIFPNGPRRTELTKTKHIASIVTLVKQGYNAEQVAKSMRLSVQHVRSLAFKAGISFGTIRTESPCSDANASRILEHTAHGLRGIAQGASLLKYRDIDLPPEDAALLLKDFRESLATIRPLLSILKERAKCQSIPPSLTP